jgi:hypothetical protein
VVPGLHAPSIGTEAAIVASRRINFIPVIGLSVAHRVNSRHIASVASGAALADMAGEVFWRKPFTARRR